MQNTIIAVKQGMEYQSHEESIYQDDFFFSPIYRQAAICLQEIVYANQSFRNRQNRNQAKFQENVKSRDFATDASVNRQLLGYPNNIIAFCAERGQGKTSAMVSFAKALENIHTFDGICRRENADFERKKDFWKNTDIPQKRFVVVDSIDPTIMEDQDSIMEAVLSRMFNQFQTEWDRRMDIPAFDCRQTESSQSERVELLQMFQKCSRNLQVISGSAVEQDADLLEQMMERGDSSNMRGALYRLVCKFLEFMCQDIENSYLVIQIDDADFNIPRAYNIIDDIRRYLVLPKVVVLLAANVTQLEVTVEQHFIAQYKSSIQNHGMATVAHCHEIAERYISKVVPGDHRIYLPELQSFIGNGYEHLQIKYLDENNTNILEEKIPGTGSVCHYQDQLLRFLHQRTGLLLLNPGSFLHNLVPVNLRELTQFLTFFNQMDKLEIDYFSLVDYFSGQRAFEAEKIKSWRDNLKQMERYLIEIWAPINLRTEGHAMLRRLSNEPDDNKNRYLLGLLPDYYGHERVKINELSGASARTEMEYREGFMEVCRNHGLSIYNSKKDGIEPGLEREHASYADVCEALNVLSALPGNNRQYKLIYAIHLLYTIRLHQLLLNQIEMAVQSEGSQSENVLVRFLTDVLYKREDMKDNPCGFPLWQHSLSPKELLTMYGIDGKKPFSAEFSLISTFCRYTEPANHSYTSCLMNPEDLRKDKENLRFNYFYSNLWDLDMLTFAKENRKRFRPDSEDGKRVRNKMAGSFALLVNWDVQYALLRNLRYYELTNGDILENMQGVYNGKYTRALLEQISRLTDNTEYDTVFDKYLDYIKAKEFGYVIQCSIPYFKKHILTKIQRELKAADEVIEVHHDDSVQVKVQNISERGALNRHLTALRDMTKPIFNLRDVQAPLDSQDINSMTLAQVIKVLYEYRKMLEDEERLNKIQEQSLTVS